MLPIDRPGSRIVDKKKAMLVQPAKYPTLSTTAARGNPQMIALLHGKTNTPRVESTNRDNGRAGRDIHRTNTCAGRRYNDYTTRTTGHGTMVRASKQIDTKFSPLKLAPRRLKLYCHSRAATHRATLASPARPLGRE